MNILETKRTYHKQTRTSIDRPAGQFFDYYGVAILREPAQAYAEYLEQCGIEVFIEPGSRVLTLVYGSQHAIANAVLAEVYA